MAKAQLIKLMARQGDSEKPDFFVSCDDRDSFGTIILDYFDRSCRRFCDAFKQGQGATGEREDILRRIVRTVCVAIFSQCDVLVSMHDFNLPMISIEPQNGFWCDRCHAGYQIGDLRFAFRDLAFADMAATTGDTRDAGDCRPCIAHVFAERVGGQKLNIAPINSSMTWLWLLLPLCEGEKPARGRPFRFPQAGLFGSF